MLKKETFVKRKIKEGVASKEVKQQVLEKYGETVSDKYIRDMKKIVLTELESVEHALLGEKYDEDKARMQLAREKKFLDKKYQGTLDEIARKDSLLDLIEVAQKDNGAYTIKKGRSGDKTESTAVACASDRHVEEVVDPDIIQGQNEYNLAIAEFRAKNYFRNTLKLINSFENETKIGNIVQWLGGDFISGYIHEELVEGNEVSPTEAILLVKKLIIAGINFYLDNSDKLITIITNHGNHGRTTQKSRIATSYKNNFEWLLYNIIADEFKDNPRVQFKIAKGYFNNIDIYKEKLRTHHGDWVKYNGGVGGIYIPTNKAIAQWNKGVPATIDCFGHRHQLIDGGNFVLNGSLIGYGPYAQSIKASPERAQQALFLINEKFGKTISAPVIVTE